MADYPIKVVHLISNMHLGGAQKLIKLVVERLRDDEFHSEVICVGSGGEYADELKAKGVRVRILPIEKSLGPGSLLRAGTLIGELRRIFETEKIDIVHPHLFFVGILARIAARLAKVKYCVYTTHMVLHPVLERTIEPILAPLVSAYVVDSEWAKRELCARLHWPEKRTRPIYNGIDRSEFEGECDTKAIRNEFGIAESTKIVSLIARIDGLKGHRYYLPAFRKALDGGLDAVLLVVGYGPKTREIEALAKSLGLENRVLFLGARADLRNILAAADVLALPSVHEGFGIVQAEAMFMRKPVIGTSQGGAPEVVQDGETGILVPYGDEGGLCEATLRLLQDEELRKNMGEAGRRRVEEHFTAERMAEAYREFYRDLLAGRFPPEA